MKDRKPVYHYNFFEIERTSIVSSVALPDERCNVSFEFRYDGGGAGQGGEAVLFENDKEVGKTRIERTVPGRFGIDISVSGATPVRRSRRSTSPHFFSLVSSRKWNGPCKRNSTQP